MSLTRNEWIEMFATLKIMQSNVNELRRLQPYLSPYRRTQLKSVISTTEHQIQLIKNQIESVIGQME